LATLVVYESARHAFGIKSGFLAGFLFALSPNVIEQAVNIRVYPLFIFWSACGFYCLVRLFGESKSTKSHWLFGVVLFSLFAIYSHFFGLLLAGSLMLATLFGKWREDKKLKVVFIGILMIGISTMGTIPFLAALVQNFGKEFKSSSANGFNDIIRLLYRQYGHPTMWTSQFILIVATLGFVLLVLLTLFPKQTGKAQSTVLLTALGSGMIVIVLGRYLVSPLVTEIRYNLWMIPGICILLSSSVIRSFKYSSIISSIAIFLIIGANLYAASQFMTKGVYYSHSRFSTINQYIKQFGVNNLTLIHERKFGAVYFPIRYSYEDQIDQYLIENCQESRPLLKKLPHLKPDKSFDSVSTSYVMFLRTDSMGAVKIATAINTGINPQLKCKFSENLISSKKWKLIRREMLISYFQTEILIFKKMITDN